MIVVSLSDLVKPESALKKWINANVELSGVKEDGAHRKICQELGRPYFDVLDYKIVCK